MIYLDNAATTAVDPSVIDEISRKLEDCFGNPSSLYDLGLASKKVLDQSRRKIADALGCTTAEVYFTACGTESNNLAILGSARARKKWGDKIVVSGFEHPSVQNTVDSLQEEGFRVVKIMPRKDGTIDPEEFLAAIDEKTVLASCMRVNNEIGTLTDTAGLAERVKKINRRTAFHCDAVQGFLKHPTELSGGIDTLSVSAHKIHGPKGIGALYIRKGFHLVQTQFGGGQENAVRSGTENIPYIAGFAKAVEMWGPSEKRRAEVTALRDELWENICGISGTVRNSPENASPFILNISVTGIRSETLLHYLESRGIYVSSGSACSKGEKSHTLSAMQVSPERADSALRFSFSSGITEEDIIQTADALKTAAATLERTRG